MAAADPTGFDHFRRGELGVGQKGKWPCGFDHYRRGQPLRSLVATPQTVVLTEPEETGLAQPLTALKTKAIGQPEEIDLAQTSQVTLKTKAVTQPSETDLAQPVTAMKTVTLGQASETDLAQTQQATQKTVTLGQPSETDLAQTQTALKTKAVGQPETTDTAQPNTSLKTVTLGQAETTDTAQPVTRPVVTVVAIGQAEETDLAQPLAPSATVPHFDFWRRTEPLGGQLGQTDNLGLEFFRWQEPLGYLVPRAVPAHTVVLTQPSETGTAQPVTAVKSRTLGQPETTSLAQPLTSLKTKTIGQASTGETCGASGYGGDWGADWGAGTVDIGISLLTATVVAVGQCTETDEAQPVSKNRAYTLGQAAETDLAQTVTALQSKIILLGQPEETDLAQPVLNNPKIRLLGQCTETDEAQSVHVVIPQIRVLGQATETDGMVNWVAGGSLGFGGAFQTELTGSVKAIQTVRQTDGSNGVFTDTPFNPFKKAHHPTRLPVRSG